MAITATLLVAAGGCASNPTRPAGTGSIDTGIRLYGTDGNMSNSFGADFKKPGAITGMVGTTPLTALTDDFKQRLDQVDPNLADDNYAGESYDAVVISALAVAVAGTTNPTTVAKYVDGVTNLQPGGVECTQVKDCLDAIAEGKDIAYRGVAVRNGLTPAGEPATASYGTLHFGQNNKIDDAKTEFVSAGNTEDASKQTAPSSGAHGAKSTQLTLGLLLPKTGAVAYLGPQMFAGAHLAVRELNAAGGILGKPVVAIDGDDGTDVNKATAQFNAFVSQNVPIMIGPPSSGEATALVPKAVAAGRILFSPSATSDGLSTIDDHGLFFRSCPPDSYQSQALADVIMRGGARRVFIVARDDAYGAGLRDGVSKDLMAAGIKQDDLTSKTYSDDQKDFGAITKAVKDFKPDAVMVAGYEESASVISALQADGIKFAQS
ncbi:ABC transporter substrate-binding protein [Rugosimonospora africana]|uniref:ABC transporter substrate-binding protein n=1 Tax=Rugosimonospora africana TaxID=556532 RepID=UPI001EF246DE|nr:ABC transporter substrate-binding protein [Rugosimonospora africana]